MISQSIALIFVLIRPLWHEHEAMVPALVFVPAEINNGRIRIKIFVTELRIAAVLLNRRRGFWKKKNKQKQKKKNVC